MLLEGAQGSLLDIDHGTYPFVTSSNTTAGGAAIGVGIAPTAIDARARRREGVHDARRQRPAADRDGGAARQSEVRTLGNEFGATTGRPRRCGWFDAVVVRYATRVNGLTGPRRHEARRARHARPARRLHGLRGRAASCTRSSRATSRRSTAWSRSTSGSTAGSGRPRTRARSTDLPSAARALPRPDRGARRGADHVRERRHAARSDHRVVTGDHGSGGLRDARRRSADRRRGAVRARGGDLGAASGAPTRACSTRAASCSTITQYPDVRDVLLHGGEARRWAACRSSSPTTSRRGATRSRTTARSCGTSDSRAAVRARDAASSGASGGLLVHSETIAGERRLTTRARRRASPPATSARRTCSACRARTCRTSRTCTARGTRRSTRTSSWSAAATPRRRRRSISGVPGARVTLVHFGPTFDKKIKPWVLPGLREPRCEEGSIAVRWDSRVTAIDAGHGVHPRSRRARSGSPRDLVYVMTGFAPNTELLAQVGVPIDPATGIPQHDPTTLETTVPGRVHRRRRGGGLRREQGVHRERPVPRRPDRRAAARPVGAGGAPVERGTGFLNKLRELVSWMS